MSSIELNEQGNILHRYLSVWNFVSTTLLFHTPMLVMLTQPAPHWIIFCMLPNVLSVFLSWKNP